MVLTVQKLFTALHSQIAKLPRFRYTFPQSETANQQTLAATKRALQQRVAK